MPTVTLKMPKPLFQLVESEARRRNISKSDLLRQAVARTIKAAASESIYHSIKDLIGSVRGPGDLSSNPAHMKGYGQSRSHRHRPNSRAARRA